MQQPQDSSRWLSSPGVSAVRRPTATMAASPASLQAHTDPLVSMTPALAPAPQASPRSTSSTYSFTTGIIIGQVSVFLLLFFVVRYVVFEDGKAGLKRRAERLKAQGRPVSSF